MSLLCTYEERGFEAVVLFESMLVGLCHRLICQKIPLQRATLHSIWFLVHNILPALLDIKDDHHSCIK